MEEVSRPSYKVAGATSTRQRKKENERMVKEGWGITVFFPVLNPNIPSQLRIQGMRGDK